MKRSLNAAGFSGRSSTVAPSRLIDAIATSLVLAGLSLCLVVTLTALSVKAGQAMPIPF